MKINLLLDITDDSGVSKSNALSAADIKATPSIATLGLSLADGKAALAKSQQMRWDPVSAYLLLQVRVRVVEGMLREDFARWYEGFPTNTSTFAKMT